jgi:uncharacterized membrane protein YhaH (DUF805 family)
MKADWFKMPDRHVTAAIDAVRPKSFWTEFGQGKIGRRDYFICLAILIVIYLLSTTAAPGIAWMLLFVGRARDTERKLWSILALLITVPEMFFLKASVNALNETYGRSVVGWVMIAVIAVHLGFAVTLGMQQSGTSKRTASSD